MKNRVLKGILLCGLFAQSSIFAGSVGGGGVPPMVDTHAKNLIALKEAALNGSLIRYTAPGSDPIYLQPDLASFKHYSLSAVDIASGNSTVFYVNTEAVTLGQSFSENLARTAASIIPGTLPVSEEVRIPLKATAQSTATTSFLFDLVK